MSWNGNTQSRSINSTKTKFSFVSYMDILIFILIGVLSRLLPHPANVTAVGGLALFTSARLNTKKSLLITFAVMIISDLVLGFHSIMWATYGSFLITIYLGTFLRKVTGVQHIVGVTLLSSIIFYLITNFAVWMIPGSMYPKTVWGLVDSYIMAIPFFRNSIIGDVGYTSIFFLSFDWVTSLHKYLQRERV